MTRVEGNPNAAPSGFYIWADDGHIVHLHWVREEREARKLYLQLAKCKGLEVQGRAA